VTPASWPQRSWGLGLLGASAGWLVHRILPASYIFEPSAAELALASFIIIGTLVFAYIIERGRGPGSIVFALLTGLVIASVLQQAGDGGVQSDEIWRLVCALVAVALAAPLFQAWRIRPAGRRLPTWDAVHDFAWTNLVLWCASFVFLGLVWLLALLLGALFDLIGIDILKRLLERRSIGFALTGAALGAGIGLLRDRVALLGTLRHVITTVLSVLAPVLALGLALFLVALPFTGLAPLWGATRATTPIILSVMVGALLLINAIIGDNDAEMPAARLFRVSAVVLAAVLLPLFAIAALSVNLRIVQHGLTPDRLWAVVFVGIAGSFAITAAIALLRPPRAGWAERLRRGNLLLAVLMCGVLMLLSTPLIDFGAIATRDQVSRLSRGTVSPEDFDWAALRFDFGPAGVAALETLKTGTLAPAQATLALQADNRWSLQRQSEAKARRAEGNDILVTLPRGTPVPAALQARIDADGACDAYPACIIRFAAPDQVEVFNLDPRDGGLDGRRSYWLGKTGWAERDIPRDIPDDAARARAAEARRTALQNGDVSVRIVERRQLFIGDEPIGQTFEPTPR
jgi:hypothetical protein